MTLSNSLRCLKRQRTNKSFNFSWTVAVAVVAALGSVSFSNAGLPIDTLPCSPSSELVEGDIPGIQLAFCAEWNPDFSYRGHLCCPKYVPRRKGKKVGCPAARAKGSYCSEMTPEQIQYSDDVASGRVGDVLAWLTIESARKKNQSFCGVNNGFLAYGRRLVASEQNRIKLRSPLRCTEFGTDPMIGMLEWMGRQVRHKYGAHEYSGVRLLVGDISAPRGGCLGGKGRRGHASHTSGQDADVGFLTVHKGRSSPDGFHKKFDAKPNWWLLKKMFQNPFACVKVVFLDRKMIAQVARVAADDPEWPVYRKFIRHVKHHKNHFHIRIGEGPGTPGCVANPHPELEPTPNEEEGPMNGEVSVEDEQSSSTRDDMSDTAETPDFLEADRPAAQPAASGL